MNSQDYCRPDAFINFLAGVAHLPLMDEVFLLHSRPPDYVQPVLCKDESCARLVICDFFKNQLQIGNGVGLDWIRDINDFLIWVDCDRWHIRPIGDQKYVVTQALRETLDIQAL